MASNLREVLLIDDYDADNFMHQMLFDEMDVADKVTITTNGQEAINYLNTPQQGIYPRPELILLDINMPVMNGWEFLEQYAQLEQGARGGIVLMMVTTSLNPDDQHCASANENVDDFVTKSLDPDSLLLLLNKHFPGRFS